MNWSSSKSLVDNIKNLISEGKDSEDGESNIYKQRVSFF